jgi:hypothetical protein
MRFDIVDLAIFAFTALGVPLIVLLRYPMKRTGAAILFGVFGLFAVALLLWRLVPLNVLARVPNADGTLEAIVAEAQPSLGNTKVLVEARGADSAEARQVIIVDQVEPSLHLTWTGNDLTISADQAALYLFNPQVQVNTPRGPTLVTVHTQVAHWVNTPGSRRAPDIPSQ